MNRLQKKCAIAAVGLHLLLAVMMVVGSAFLSANNSPVVTPIDFVPSRIIEGAIAGGGNPNANPPPPAPPAPPQAAVTPPVQPVKVEPLKETVKTEVPKIEKAVPVPISKPAKPTPEISTKLVTRKPGDKAKAASDSKAADAKRAADQVGKAVAGLKNNLAPTTTIDLRGPGGGGETYAGVEQAILSVYDRAWISPEGMDASEAVAEVSVTIESDGTVSSSHITKSSGDTRVDRSIQQALDRVRSIPGWDGKRRTVQFSFQSRAKAII